MKGESLPKLVPSPQICMWGSDSNLTIVQVQEVVGKSGEHPPRQLQPQRLKFQLS